jgi:hypothetical protein
MRIIWNPQIQNDELLIVEAGETYGALNGYKPVTHMSTK